MRKLIATVRLGRDAEIKTDKKGQEFVSFTAASQEYNEEEPMWLNCMSYSPIVRNILRHLTKGRLLVLTGDYSQHYYGVDNKVSHDMMVNAADFLPGPKNDENGGRHEGGSAQGQGRSQAKALDNDEPSVGRLPQPPAQYDSPAVGDDSDDLPF